MLPGKFGLVIGNSRSGTTIVGAILDSHPKMLCANETSASAIFWRNMDRAQILHDIVDNCRRNLDNGRASQGYTYGIETKRKDPADIEVVGDKIWNPAVLLIAGQRDLLSSLEDRTGAEIALVHCVRNPFDVIATMHRRSGASVRDRLGWYGMHCEAIQIIIERGGQPVFLMRHEDLVERPTEMSRGLFEWFGCPTTDGHLEDIAKRVHREARRTRHEVDWTDDMVRAVERLSRRYPFLDGYTYD